MDSFGCSPIHNGKKYKEHFKIWQNEKNKFMQKRNIRWFCVWFDLSENLHLTQHISNILKSKLFSDSPIFVANNKFSRCRHWSQMICSRASVYASVIWNRILIYHFSVHSHFSSKSVQHFVLFYLLRTVSGIVKRQTPFRNSTKCLLVPLRMSVSLWYHSMYGYGSHWTMHSNRAVCPLITAISLSG